MIDQTFSGIEVLGNIPWGTHLCHFYETKEDLLEILVPYFKTGLENHEYCLWITSDPLDPKEAILALNRAVPGLDQYIADDKIEILSHEEWYLKKGPFNLTGVLGGWQEKYSQSSQRGFSGMRISGDTGWVDPTLKENFFQYERKLDAFLHKNRMIALCTYSLHTSSALDVLDVAIAHEIAIAKRKGKWEIVEVSENKRTKAQIQLQNEELEQRVTERTRELTEANDALRREIRERQLAKDELRLAYQQLTYHLESTPLGVVEWDKDLFVKRWSKRAEEIFGWKESEVHGVNMYDPGFSIIYKEDLKAVNEVARQLMKGKVERKLILNRNITKDGKVIYCEWYNSVLRDEHNNVITILSLVHNVTKRVEAEQQKEFEQRDKLALINTTEDMIWSVGSDFKLIAFNKAFAQSREGLTGVPVKPGDEILLSDVFPDDIKAYWREAYNWALSGKKFKKEIYTPALNLLPESWRETFINPIYQDNTVIAVACYSRDITERKFTDELIKQSEAHLAEAQRLAKLGSWSYDIEADKLTWSDELYHVFGADKQSFNETHRSFLDLIDDEDREFAFQTSRHTQQTGEPFTIEYRVTTPKGEKRIIKEYGYGLTNDNGRVLRLFGTAQDITERKKSEEELHELNEELRMLSSHLQNVREEERMQIARNVHDELGQQLTGLKLDVNWLKRKIETEDERIKQKINDIIDLIDETLQSVRRISSDLRPSLLDDFGLIAALEWHSEEVAKRSETEVNFKADMPELEIPVATESGIFRIYQELLTNAVRHANARVITSSLQLIDNHLILRISDDGQGMDPAVTGTKKTLGLIGVKERTFALGGKFDLMSQPGKGTEVQISIPL